MMSADGIKIHYYHRNGAPGPHVMLVHGLAASLAFWYPRLLPSLGRDYRVTAFDLRGHGRSDMPSSGYTTRDMAGDVHAMMEHLHIETAHLVGHSFGGAVALHYAVLHPERVSTLTLADARVRALQPGQRLEDWPVSEKIKQRVAEAGATSVDSGDVGYGLLKVLAEAKVRGEPVDLPSAGQYLPFGGQKASTRTAERWLALVAIRSSRAEFAAVAGLTVARIRELKNPVLAVFGEYSNCLPSCWSLKRHLPSTKVVIVPGAGHFHPFTKPDFFEEQLRSFIHPRADIATEVKGITR
jgi:pimeloyl-ACP methyl ester carboxylesterase